MPLGPLLTPHPSLAATGEISVAGSATLSDGVLNLCSYTHGRPNLVACPYGDGDSSAWDAWSVNKDVVTQLSKPIPDNPASPSTALISLSVESQSSRLEQDYLDFISLGLSPGDWLAVQAEVFVYGEQVSDAGAVLSVSVKWKRSGGVPAWPTYLVNATYLEDPSVENISTLDTLLPLDGFQRITANVQIPETVGGSPPTEAAICIEVLPRVDVPDGADTACLGVTNVQVEAGSEFGDILPFNDFFDVFDVSSVSGEAALSTPQSNTARLQGEVTFSVWTPDAFLQTILSPMSASCSLSISTAGWLYLGVPGENTFSAVGGISLVGSAVRLSSSDDVELPPTDDDGWYTAGVDIPPLRGLSVSTNLGLALEDIEDISIDLDVAGGPIGATITAYSSNLRGSPRLGSSVRITYKGQALFIGRLESYTVNVGETAGYTLTYAGMTAALRDRKNFRRVFVDSDLQNWKTDQGPRTSPDTFEVASRSSGQT